MEDERRGRGEGEANQKAKAVSDYELKFERGHDVTLAKMLAISTLAPQATEEERAQWMAKPIDLLVNMLAVRLQVLRDERAVDDVARLKVKLKEAREELEEARSELWECLVAQGDMENADSPDWTAFACAEALVWRFKDLKKERNEMHKEIHKNCPRNVTGRLMCNH
ncbi:MAG: hypothetical protein EBR10_11240 [Planctomycetes bacterium]|nr:hypothetical protein [Planctomycetota bacterium]